MPELTDIQRLLAYEEIRQLVARYALSADRRDLDQLVSLFVEDVEVGKLGTGRAALKESFRVGFAPLGMTILSVTTQVIDLIDDTTATGEVYCTGEIDRDGTWIRQAILYRDSYRRTGEGWRFVRRNHLLWYSSPFTEDPRHLAPANWPKGHIGRGTVPECFETFRDFIADNTDS